MNYREKRTEWSDASKRVNFLICGLLLLPIYIKLMNAATLLVPFKTISTTYLYYGIMWGLLISVLPEMIDHIRLQLFLGLLLVALYFNIALFLHPDSMEFVLPVNMDMERLVAFRANSVVELLPWFLLGVSVSNIDHLTSLLHKCARVGVLCAFLVYAVKIGSDINIHYDDMDMAYNVSLFICLLIIQWRKREWIYVTIGMVCMILAGTRGPIVCILMAIICKVFFVEMTSMRRAGVILLCLISGIILYIGLEHILVFIEDLAHAVGIKRLRLVDYINEGLLLDSSGRSDFTRTIWKSIATKPLFGFGLGADRELLGGRYVHNIFLEALISLGIIGTIAFFAVIFYAFFRALGGKDDYKKLVLGLFCGIFIKLQFSQSFLTCKDLFVFIGICYAISRQNLSTKMQLAPSSKMDGEDE